MVENPCRESRELTPAIACADRIRSFDDLTAIASLCGVAQQALQQFYGDVDVLSAAKTLHEDINLAVCTDRSETVWGIVEELTPQTQRLRGSS